MTYCYDILPCPNHENITVCGGNREREIPVNFKCVRSSGGRNVNDSCYVVLGFNVGNIKLKIIRQVTRQRGETITGSLLLHVIVDAEELFVREPGGAEASILQMGYEFSKLTEAMVHLADYGVPDDNVIGNW